jgi:S1-C subfamily serine protease
MRKTGFAYLAVAFLILLAQPLVTGKAAAQQVPESREQISMSFAPVVRDTAPSVVNVYAKRIVQSQGRAPFGADPFFRRFFGDELFGGRPRQRAQNSLGSGVIVDSSGIVVTNNHVIRGGTEIRVVLHDNREFDAELVLTDERTDLAILRIKPDEEDPLVPLALGDSDAIEVGDLVLAIGNPFGVGQTVTRHCFGAGAHPRRGVVVPVLHSDRCSHQPRQLGWCTGRHERSPDWYQHRDLLAFGRIERHWLCHSGQHGALGH